MSTDRGPIQSFPDVLLVYENIARDYEQSLKQLDELLEHLKTSRITGVCALDEIRTATDQLRRALAAREI